MSAVENVDGIIKIQLPSATPHPYSLTHRQPHSALQLWQRSLTLPQLKRWALLHISTNFLIKVIGLDNLGLSYSAQGPRD